MATERDATCRRCGGYFGRRDGAESNRGIHDSCDVDDRTMLLQLLASLTLCDHMGDVAGDVLRTLKWAGVALLEEDENDGGEWSSQVARTLHAQGITTIYGTEVGGDDND